MKSVVVTGANRGIGLELVKQLLDSGFRVYATHRSEMGGLANLNNQNLSIHQMDVRDQEAIEKLSNSIDGKIDVLINNAGVADGRWQSISEIDMQHALDVIEVNSIAPPSTVMEPTNSDPKIGPVHEKDTIANVNAIKNVPIIPPIEAKLSERLTQVTGKVSS